MAEMKMRLEKPKIHSRMAKEKENLAKREQALTDATCKWQSMDVKDVLAPALLELSQHGSSRKKPIKTRDDSALAFLVKDNADLCDKYKLKITAASPQVGASSGSSHKRRPTPKKASARGRQHSRSADRSPSNKNAKPHSILRGRGSGSRRTSSRSTSRESSQKKVRFAKTTEKGKGQGKSKSKKKQKGK